MPVETALWRINEDGLREERRSELMMIGSADLQRLSRILSNRNIVCKISDASITEFLIERFGPGAEAAA